MPVNNTEPLSVYRAGPGYAPCLAEMLLAASRGHLKRGFLDALLSLPEPRILKLLTLMASAQPQRWARIENAFVALVDGVCAGIAVARPATNAPELLEPKALFQAGAALKLTTQHIEAILVRQAQLCNAQPARTEPLAPGVWFVDCIGVRYENRSAGVGRALLSRIIEESAPAGATALETWCVMGNTRAQGLFTALGFTVEQQRLYPADRQAAWGQGVQRLRLDLRA